MVYFSVICCPLLFLCLERGTSVEKRKTTTRDMTQGNIVKQVLLFALPLMLGNLLQQMYNIADTWVVGRFLGADALAAVGIT